MKKRAWIRFRSRRIFYLLISTAEDVILHKLVWNQISPSDRQLRDAAGIVVVQAEALDRRYLRKWAATSNVRDELNRLLAGEIRPKNT